MANNPKQDEEFSFHEKKMTHKKGEGGVGSSLQKN
jgi:hypothetical protein